MCRASGPEGCQPAKETSWSHTIVTRHLDEFVVSAQSTFRGALQVKLQDLRSEIFVGSRTAIATIHVIGDIDAELVEAPPAVDDFLAVSVVESEEISP